MRTTRTVAPALALVLVGVYSIVATATSGALAGLASPLLIAAIVLCVWHDRGVDQS